jgi:acetylcholinesterase
MKFTILATLALVTPIVLSEPGCQADGQTDDLTIETTSGTYTGLIDPKYPNTRQFRAIPFAEPPVLQRRFSPPEKSSRPASEHHYATRFPASCPQFVTSIISIYDLPLTKGNLIYNGNQNDTSGLVGEATSEDCLYNAIWTPVNAPKPPAAGLPVLVFMTGGGLILGGVDIPWQFPDSWVERTQSHIVVTMNYRLNILGFPNARGIHGQQNLGILDQRMSLEWVRDNIAAFGGDPNRIMLWGQSAGSVAVDLHSYAWPEDPIAQSHYMQSGSAIFLKPRSDPTHSNFTFVAKAMGCEPPCHLNDDQAADYELDCMRQVPMAMIENFVGQYTDSGKTPVLPYFQEIVDDKIIFSNYSARAEAGKLAHVPALFSITSNEFSTLVPWPANNVTEGPYQPAVTALDIASGVCPTLNSTVYRNRQDIPVFRIQYAAEFPNLNVYKWLGAYHASDLPTIFGTYHLLDGVANTTQYEIDVSRAYQDHVLAFASDPYHGPQKMGWQPMNASLPDGGDLLRFGGSSGKIFEHVPGIEVDGVCDGSRDYNPFP